MLWLLTHSAPAGQGPGSLESLLTKFRSLVTSTNLLTFYSCQRTWARRPRVQPLASSDILHLPTGISTISDTYLHSVLDTWYFGSFEKYVEWLPQLDHHTSRVLDLDHRLIADGCWIDF